MDGKTVLALSGSNSQHSINRKLVQYVAGQVVNFEVSLHHWTNYKVPIYGIDLEKERGIPADIRVFKNTIDPYEALMIAVNEHNLGISSFFKNILDWTSRLDSQFLKGKKIMLMSTSESEDGAHHALEYMEKVVPLFGGEVVESFSLPSFSANFDKAENRMVNEVMALGLREVITNFEQVILE